MKSANSGQTALEENGLRRNTLGNISASMPDLSFVNPSSLNEVSLNRTLRFEAVRPLNINALNNELTFLRTENFNLRAHIFLLKEKYGDTDDDIDIVSRSQESTLKTISQLKQEIELKDQALQEARNSNESIQRQLDAALKHSTLVNEANTANSQETKGSDTKLKHQRKMLTVAEKVDLLDMLNEGKSYAAIGRRYGIDESSVRYVKNDKKNISETAAVSLNKTAKRVVLQSRHNSADSKMFALGARIETATLFSEATKKQLEEKDTEIATLKERIVDLERDLEEKRPEYAKQFPFSQSVLSPERAAFQNSMTMQSTGIESGLAVPSSSENLVIHFQNLYVQKAMEVESLKVQLKAERSATSNPDGMAPDLECYEKRIQCLTDELAKSTAECTKRSKVIRALLRKLDADGKTQAKTSPEVVSQSFQHDVSVLYFLEKSLISRSDMEEFRTKFFRYHHLSQQMLTRLKSSARLVEEIARRLGDDKVAHDLLISLSVLHNDMSETLNFTTEILAHIDSESHLMIEDTDDVKEAIEIISSIESPEKLPGKESEMIRSLEENLYALKCQLEAERQQVKKINADIEEKDKKLEELLSERAILTNRFQQLERSAMHQMAAKIATSDKDIWLVMEKIGLQVSILVYYDLVKFIATIRF
ncbi:unnamed protein product [Soboliphyme baturini]|uniref:HTH psq-type domain-containing protein n=1 Tax=Soboliphyme baturini TaxID=241478 RepID=A0A183IP55_9BILA|nr:unnamed protein product [Soboliphyme baturini]